MRQCITTATKFAPEPTRRATSYVTTLLSTVADVWYPSRTQGIIVLVVVVLAAWRAGQGDWSGASVAIAVGAVFVGIFEYKRY